MKAVPNSGVIRLTIGTTSTSNRWPNVGSGSKKESAHTPHATSIRIAITGKPMVFYAYDFETYRDSIRGFYFDYMPVAPGPVVRTSAEVIEHLHDLAGVQTGYADRYAEFRRTFCHLEDGHAADRLDWLTERTAAPLR